MAALRVLSACVLPGTAVTVADAPDIVWMRGGSGLQFSSTAISADGARLVSGDGLALVKLWRLPDGILLRTFEGHSNSIECVALAPDGATAASIDSGGILKLWVAQDGSARWTVSAQTGNLNLAAFSPDGTLVATGGGNSKVRLWNASDGAFVRELAGHSLPVRSLLFSPDSQILISVSWDRSILIWQVSDGTPLGVINLVYRPWAAALSPDGDLVAVGQARQVQVWRISDGALVHTLAGHLGTVLSVAFSNDGATLAAGDSSGGVKLWSVPDETARDVQAASTGSTFTSFPVALTGDGASLVFLSTNQDLEVWRSSDSSTHPISAHRYNVISTAFSPDGQRLASSGSQSGMRVYRTMDGAPDPVLDPVSPLAGRGLAFSPDGALMAGGIGGGQLRLWRVTDGQTIGQIDTGSAGRLAFSPDGTSIASDRADNSVGVWKVADGSLQWNLAGHADVVYALAFSPDGRLLASGSADTTLKLWNVADGRLENTLTGHSNWVRAVAFAPGGQALASGSEDGTIRLWTTNGGPSFQTIEDEFPVHSVVFAQDGNHLFSASGSTASIGLGAVRIWQLPGGTPLRAFKQEVVYPGSLHLSPDQSLLAYGRLDGTVVIARNPLANVPPAPRLNLERSSNDWVLRVTGISGPNLTLQWSPNLQDWFDETQFPSPPSSLDLPLLLDAASKFYRTLQR